MKQTFQITGMHCAGCSENITKALSKVAGVNKATVTYTTEKATIDYDEKNIDWQMVKKAVSSIGSYQIIFPTKNSNPHSTMDHSPLKTLKQKTFISGFLTLVIILGSMLELINNQTAFVLTAVILAYSGKEFFISTLKGLKTFTANMDTLIAIGTGAAFLYSTVVTYFPKFFSGPQPVYFETAGAIITLILLGRYLESLAKGKASEAIKKLLNLQVKKAIVLRNGQEIKVDLSEVKKGDTLVVKPGAKVPVDAMVIKGQSYIDEALVTGESKPVKKQAGDKVIGSTINKQGLLIIKATGVGDQTMLAQIVKLVEEAQGSKAPIQKLADKVSGIFVPSVILISLLAFLVWYFVLGLAFSSSLVIAITILIVSCPCALGLATPISIMVGTGIGAKNGILIKNAEKLQITGSLKAIVFDKTGTLTQGDFKVTEIISTNKTLWPTNKILQLAASLEQGSQHPIAEAILKKAKIKNQKLLSVSNFKDIEGKGVSGEINHQKILLGNQKLIKAKSLLIKGQTEAYLSVDGQTIGALALEDSPKESASQVIKDLKDQGLKVIMISGDNQATAQNIADRLGIDQVLANVLPQDKVLEVKKLKDQYGLVAMVGDGVNDAPALAQASVGITMATGTDVAIEAGDITLLNGQIELIAKTINLSKETMRNIKQNLFWAFGYNALLIPIAAGFLKPIGLAINPIFASGAMAFSSLSVILNALRLRRIKI